VTDSSVPVRRRVVALEADLGAGMPKRWRYGSGLLIGARRVLTAAHVVRDGDTVTVRRVNEAPWTVDLAASLISDLDGTDLALLEVSDAELLGNVPVAVVDRDVANGKPLLGAWAVGSPKPFAAAAARAPVDQRGDDDTPHRHGGPERRLHPRNGRDDERRGRLAERRASSG